MRKVNEPGASRTSQREIREEAKPPAGKAAQSSQKVAAGARDGFDVERAKQLHINLTPSSLPLLSLGQLEGVPVERAIAAALRKAAAHFPEPHLQQLSIGLDVNGELLLTAHVYDRDQTQVFWAHFGADGKPKEVDHPGGKRADELYRPPEPTHFKTVRGLPSGAVPFSEAAEKVARALPAARFNHAGLAISKEGKLEYQFWHSADWAIEKAARVDVLTGKLTVTGRDPKTFEERILNVID